MARVLAAAFAVLALHVQPAVASDPPSAPVLSALVAAQRATQAELRSKCLPVHPVQYAPAWTMPVGLRPWALALWRQRLRDARVARSACDRIAHRAMWLCIHALEAPPWSGGWSADTGNGYYGGLQMTYGWLGLIAGRASDMEPEAQMAAAERGYRASGWSRSWLYGQWPRTAPPCT